MHGSRLKRGSIFAALVLLVWVGGAVGARGAELVAAQGPDAPWFDPGMKPTPDAQQVITMIYDTLIQRDDAMQLKPGLAVSWRNVDPLTWQIKLRSGVKFHNGEPFDSRSVKFTLERLSTPGDKAGGHVTAPPFVAPRAPWTPCRRPSKPSTPLPC